MDNGNSTVGGKAAVNAADVPRLGRDANKFVGKYKSAFKIGLALFIVAVFLCFVCALFYSDIQPFIINAFKCLDGLCFLLLFVLDRGGIICLILALIFTARATVLAKKARVKPKACIAILILDNLLWLLYLTLYVRVG